MLQHGSSAPCLCIAAWCATAWVWLVLLLYVFHKPTASSPCGALRHGKHRRVRGPPPPQELSSPSSPTRGVRADPDTHCRRLKNTQTDRGEGPSDGCREEDVEGGSREQQHPQTHHEGLSDGGEGTPGQEKVQEAKSQPEEQAAERVEGRRGGDVARSTHYEIGARNEHGGQS